MPKPNNSNGDTTTSTTARQHVLNTLTIASIQTGGHTLRQLGHNHARAQQHHAQ